MSSARPDARPPVRATRARAAVSPGELPGRHDPRRTGRCGMVWDVTLVPSPRRRKHGPYGVPGARTWPHLARPGTRRPAWPPCGTPTAREFLGEGPGALPEWKRDQKRPGVLPGRMFGAGCLDNVPPKWSRVPTHALSPPCLLAPPPSAPSLGRDCVSPLFCVVFVLPLKRLGGGGGTDGLKEGSLSPCLVGLVWDVVVLRVPFGI